jgi:hypothetical protein
MTQGFERTRSIIVLTADDVSLPREIEHKVYRYDLGLPERDELRNVDQTVIRSLNAHHSIKLDLRPSDLEGILQALARMTLNKCVRPPLIAPSKMANSRKTTFFASSTAKR